MLVYIDMIMLRGYKPVVFWLLFVSLWIIGCCPRCNDEDEDDGIIKENRDTNVNNEKKNNLNFEIQLKEIKKEKNKKGKKNNKDKSKSEKEEKKIEEEKREKEGEEDRLRKEEEEKIRRKNEERIKREEEERKRKEDEERLKKEEEEKIRRENEERIKREEEEEIIKKLKLTKKRYRLTQKEIGKGGWGTVHKYYDDENNENVAIKFLSPKTAGIDECKILEILKEKQHVNIVKIKDIFEDDKYMFFVEEFCEYNLFTYYKEHESHTTKGEYNFTDEDRMCLFFQLINGLEFLHELNIAHRDLKLSNLLVTKEGILKICDFGDCYHCEKKGGHTSSIKGTEGHMAPEIHNGKYHDPFKADIWSCGIILWAMFNYHHIIDTPRKGSKITTYDEYYERYKNITIDDLKNCENELCKDLVFEMLSYEPDKRPTIEEIKKTDLYIKGKESFIKKYRGKFKEIDDKIM